ncbi:hypothetical protein RAM_24000 [Amycolatopsis mediterranei S699]|uniref:Uncharacterized protein n=1 Tax=Amycolatopsis mediterranei (strain S699) TaxID=713604 RepID=A0A9R0NZ37_AMYMS|nr:hypothetical protein RAM_24000 [Amycolatopsis mediterranei S699]
MATTPCHICSNSSGKPVNPADGGIQVRRQLAFGFRAPLRWLVEPVLRRRLRADVEAEVRGAKRLLER